MRQARSYDKEFKAQAVKLAREIGTKRAAAEPGIPVGTLGGWVHAVKAGNLSVGGIPRAPENAVSLAEEVQRLRAENKKQAKEIKRLTELNEFLEEASAFFEVMLAFPASRRKSGKSND